MGLRTRESPFTEPMNWYRALGRKSLDFLVKQKEWVFSFTSKINNYQKVKLKKDEKNCKHSAQRVDSLGRQRRSSDQRNTRKWEKIHRWRTRDRTLCWLWPQYVPCESWRMLEEHQAMAWQTIKKKNLFLILLIKIKLITFCLLNFLYFLLRTPPYETLDHNFQYKTCSTGSKDHFDIKLNWSIPPFFWPRFPKTRMDSSELSILF